MDVMVDEAVNNSCFPSHIESLQCSFWVKHPKILLALFQNILPLDFKKLTVTFKYLIEFVTP
jgi:hypothetical protein